MSRKLLFSLLMLGGVIGLLGVFSIKGVNNMNTKKAYRLDEPLLLEGEKQNSYSLLPQGTVLYYDKSWDVRCRDS